MLVKITTTRSALLCSGLRATILLTYYEQQCGAGARRDNYAIFFWTNSTIEAADYGSSAAISTFSTKAWNTHTDFLDAICRPRTVGSKSEGEQDQTRCLMRSASGERSARHFRFSQRLPGEPAINADAGIPASY